MAKSQSKTRWTETHRRRWTAADAEEVLAALKRSGLPASRFAAEHGLDPERLRRWRRRLEAAPPRPRRRLARPGPMTFAEVAVSGGHLLAGGTSERFEIVLGRGRIVRVGPSFDAAALRQLLRILDEADGGC